MRGIKKEVQTNYVAEHNGIVGCPCCGATYRVWTGAVILICCHGVRLKFINIPEAEFKEMFRRKK